MASREDQVQGYSPALRGALRSGAYGSVLQAAGGAKYMIPHTWYPVYPPEVGYLGSHGLCHPVRCSEIQYNAPYPTGISLCTAGTAEQKAKRYTGSYIP